MTGDLFSRSSYYFLHPLLTGVPELEEKCTLASRSSESLYVMVQPAYFLTIPPKMMCFRQKTP